MNVSASLLREFLNSSALGVWSSPRILVVDSAASTMDLARENIQGRELFSCLAVALEQTAGRGQHNRVWQSPKGGGLYLSWGLVLPLAVSALEGFTLMVGLSARAALLPFCPDLKLKWPNDLCLVASGAKLNDPPKKLGGVLVESLGGDEQSKVIVGLGVNIFTAPSGAVALASCTPLNSKNPTSIFAELITSLTQELLRNCHKFIIEGFKPFVSDWHKASFLNGKRVQIGNIQGVAEGVNERGAILVRDNLGHQHECYSGSVELVAGESHPPRSGIH